VLLILPGDRAVVLDLLAEHGGKFTPGL